MDVFIRCKEITPGFQQTPIDDLVKNFNRNVVKVKLIIKSIKFCRTDETRINLRAFF